MLKISHILLHEDECCNHSLVSRSLSYSLVLSQAMTPNNSVVLRDLSSMMTSSYYKLILRFRRSHPIDMLLCLTKQLLGKHDSCTPYNPVGEGQFNIYLDLLW